MHYLIKAYAAGKNIMELESIKMQTDIFESFSPELQEALLAEILMAFIQPESDEEMPEIDMQEMYEAFIMLLEAVKNGDDVFMKAVLGVGVEREHPLDIEYYTKFHLERDKGMAEKIDGFLKSGDNGDYFIIAGAAHFVGENTITGLLEAMGYTLERIK